MKNLVSLVTGASGFVGSHLFNELQNDGSRVIGVDIRPPSSYGDVCNKKQIERLVRDVDIVYHLAAHIHVAFSWEHPIETVKTNFMGTLNVLEACRKFDKRMVYASSCEIFGTAQYAPMNENHPLYPHTPYAASKLAAERMCYSYWKTYGLRVQVLRQFNTFGERQNDDTKYGGVIAIFTRRVLEGLPPIIFGDGLQTRDFMYIEDLLQGYEVVTNSNVYGKPINIGTGREVTIKYVAEKILEYCGRKDLKPIYTNPRPADVMRFICDNSLARSLGFKPKWRFEDALKRYVEWSKANFCLQKEASGRHLDETMDRPRPTDVSWAQQARNPGWKR